MTVTRKAICSGPLARPRRRDKGDLDQNSYDFADFAIPRSSAAAVQHERDKAHENQRSSPVSRSKSIDVQLGNPLTNTSSQAY
jgi:hypothetical protein